MLQLTLFIETSPDFFISWLGDHTRGAANQIFPTEKGKIGLNRARPLYPPGYFGTNIMYVGMGGFYYYTSNGNEDFAFPLSEIIRFKIVPLTSERIEVIAECTQPVAENYFLDLLESINKRWPQSPDFETRLKTYLTEIKQSLDAGLTDIKQGLAILYKRLEDDTYQKSLAQILELIQAERMNQGEMRQILDAIRRALQILLSPDTQLDTEIRGAIVSANKAIESEMDLQQKLELTLPIIPFFLNHKIELAAGSSINLNATYDELRKRWESLVTTSDEGDKDQ